ncbi:hypothetical protein ONZ45_g9024 [Pleurotus djamor]|nr:hypothetical protein ONZ45_g9024 [Pleurotus djamor]
MVLTHPLSEATCQTCGFLTGSLARASPKCPTAYVPHFITDHEESVAFARRLDHDVEILDHHISSMQAQLDQLKSMRSAASLRSAHTKNRVIPAISRLPDEVMLHIFHLGSRPDSSQSSDLDALAHSRLRPLVPVSHVCHRWRDLVLSEARLWTFIALPLAESLLSVYLSRSKSRPLTIMCTNPETPLSPLLLNHSHRWRSLIYPNAHVFRQLQSPKIQLPMLQSVVQGGKSAYPQQTYHHSFPRHQIHRLVTRFTEATSDMQWVFVKFDHLVSLEVTLGPECGYAPLELSLSHPQLRHLCLNLTQPIHPSASLSPLNLLLRNLTLPALETLRITSTSISEAAIDELLGNLSGFLSRSSCPLRVLQLVGNGWSPLKLLSYASDATHVELLRDAVPESLKPPPKFKRVEPAAFMTADDRLTPCGIRPGSRCHIDFRDISITSQ